MLQAFEEKKSDKSEKTSDSAAVKRDVYEKYDKLDELITYFRKGLDAIEDPYDYELIAMYDNLPEPLQKALCKIYFTMPRGEQNEIMIASGCNVMILRQIIEEEIACRMKKQPKKAVRFIENGIVVRPGDKKIPSSATKRATKRATK